MILGNWGQLGRFGADGTTTSVTIPTATLTLNLGDLVMTYSQAERATFKDIEVSFIDNGQEVSFKTNQITVTYR